MDVDLLRPGTVPISADTVLWFEFLLDESLLLKHLMKLKADPSGTDLIMKFTNAVLESIKNDTKRMDIDHDVSVESNSEQKPKDTLKNLALKILSLRVSAFLKWNLDIWESKLPMKIQICLLQDLFYFTNEKTEIPNVPDCDLSTVSDPYLFALILYHRWVIRMAVQHSFHSKIMKPLGETVLGTLEDFYMCTPELIMNSVNFLTAILTLNHFPHVLTFDTFKMLTEDSKEIDQDWDKSIEISPFEYEAQIHYDLGCFYFNRENYEMAKQHFFKSSESYYSLNIDADLEYASFDMKCLNGYLAACNVPVIDYSPSLLQQMNASIADQYTGILNILQEDNLVRDIPQMYRTVLELDIQGALSSGKFTVARDLLLQVQMLNVVRNVLDGSASFAADFIHRLKCGGTKAMDILFWAVSSVMDRGMEDDKSKVKKFFIKILMSEDLPELLERLLADTRWKGLMSDEDLGRITQAQVKLDDVVVSPALMTNNWIQPNISIKRNAYLEARIIEEKLISCYDIQTIKELLVQLSATSPAKPLWRINSTWELAIPLQSVVVSLTRGILQDLAYVLLAKSKELMNVRDFDTSHEMLNALETEVKAASSLNPNVAYKLCRLVGWEALLVRITQTFAEWPTVGPGGRESLVAQCKSCLSALEDRNDTVLPRLEVIERCALCLLNLSEWEYLCGLEKRWSYFEMAAAVAYACQDLTKYKGNKKVSRDMWDLVLPIFGPNMSQTKRSSSGNTTIVHRDSPNVNNRSHLISFLACLRDLTALSVVISMLARLYNVLKDEANLELNVQYINLWPAVISNANSYNSKAVFEILSHLVTRSLELYPDNVAWLRLMGDINFGNGHHEMAMRHYLESLAVATDHFNQPVCKGAGDDHVFRRMIKCCSNISCYTQAAILSQFLDETDYTLAFKCLSESKSVQVCYDAVDAYYGCIWDTTLLEYLVHLHHKRGEHHRKQQAVKAIGMLELNSNNNEEIQREAMNVRKSRFLRALAKHYLAKSL